MGYKPLSDEQFEEEVEALRLRLLGQTFSVLEADARHHRAEVKRLTKEATSRAMVAAAANTVITSAWAETAGLKVELTKAREEVERLRGELYVLADMFDEGDLHEHGLPPLKQEAINRARAALAGTKG